MLDPVSVFTPLGSNATFTCAIDDDEEDIDTVSWVINGENAANIEIDYYSEEDMLAPLRERGIYFSIEGLQINLIVEATISNNGSNFLCKQLINLPPAEFSPMAYLTIIGKLLLI